MLDFGVLLRGHALQLLRQPRLRQLLRRLLRLPRTLQLIRQRIALLLHRAQRLRHRQVTLHTARIQLRLQGLNLGIFGRSRLLQLIGHLGLRQRHRTALVLLGQLQSLM